MFHYVLTSVIVISERLLEATTKMRQICIEKAQGSPNSEELNRRADMLASDIGGLHFSEIARILRCMIFIVQ